MGSDSFGMQVTLSLSTRFPVLWEEMALTTCVVMCRSTQHNSVFLVKQRSETSLFEGSVWVSRLGGMGGSAMRINKSFVQNLEDMSP